MGLLANYAKVSITKSTAGALNEYAEPTYATSTIYGVKESTNKLVRDRYGAEVVANTLIMTETSLTVGDKVDGDIVMRVDTVRDINGAVSHYEAYTQ
jgi:hypothetical protein